MEQQHQQSAFDQHPLWLFYVLKPQARRLTATLTPKMCFLCKPYCTDLITSCHSCFYFFLKEGFHVIFYVMENEVCSLFKFKTTTGCNRGLLNCIQVSVTGPHVFVFLVNFYILSSWFAFHLDFEDSHLCHVRLMNAQSWPCLHTGCGNLTKKFIRKEKTSKVERFFFFPQSQETKLSGIDDETAKSAWRNFYSFPIIWVYHMTQRYSHD